MDKIFVLGDSRTGTTSLHRFFLDLGYDSIHYYPKEANLVDPIHDDWRGNWKRLKLFYLNTSHNAFSDFPTRFFYKEIFKLFPEAFYILTLRESVAKWRQSMRNYFTKQGQDIDLDHLTWVHNYLNAGIRKLFAAHQEARFLELIIDEDSESNSEKLKAFLHKHPSPVSLQKLNVSK